VLRRTIVVMLIAVMLMTSVNVHADIVVQDSAILKKIAELIAKQTKLTESKLPVLPEENDLVSVSLTSEAIVEIRGQQGKDNPHNVDFSVLFRLYKPMEPQYIDTENLLVARFGKDNAAVKEIMVYIKSKDERKKELPDKRWSINGQTIRVGSHPNSMTIDLTVWRAK